MHSTSLIIQANLQVGVSKSAEKSNISANQSASAPSNNQKLCRNEYLVGSGFFSHLLIFIDRLVIFINNLLTSNMH